MKTWIVAFCLLFILAISNLGCQSTVNEYDYKYKIYVGSGGIQSHIVYSDNFIIDANGFLTAFNPHVSGEPQLSRAVCSPGTYLILER